MPQDRKVAAVVHQDLEIWQKLNDADGTRYAPLIGLPVLVFAGSSEDLARARRRALERGLEPAIYTRALFGPGSRSWGTREETSAILCEFFWGRIPGVCLSRGAGLWRLHDREEFLRH
ncbi:MAG: DUF2000 family protein [Rhodospirillales bacterium]|nr:DUF2000 family protein [Rhodospirillales bacterium]